MLQAMADAAIDEVKTKYHFKGRREGGGSDGWLLVDFGDVILHVFSNELREYYNLEELWNTGKVLLKMQ